MNQGKRYAVLGLGLLSMGAVRLPIERQLTTELGEAGLLPPKIEQRTGEKIGQTMFAVSLGGLRTLVATFMNLRAFNFFTEQRWGDVGDTFEMIVDLAPNTRYYWDTGSWHQSYNASAYYLYESKLPALRRKVNWRASIIKGREFLERGISMNPDDPFLKQRLGFMLSDPSKVTAFGGSAKSYEAAYEAYIGAVRTGGAQGFAKRFALYSLARVPGREKDALELFYEIKAEDNRMTPTMLGVSYALRYHEDPSQPVMKLIDSIFPSHEVAYDTLGSMWTRTRDQFPVFGVGQGIALLEKELKIPDEKSLLTQPLPPPVNIDQYFTPN
jgi:hypothetical protein